MQTLVLVGAGGALGALARFGLSAFVQRRVASSFPIGTLVVNALGCLAMGALLAAVMEREAFDPRLRQFVAIGVLGSFTTFSTFGAETLELMQKGQLSQALGSVALNLVLGLAAVWVGQALVRASLS